MPNPLDIHQATKQNNKDMVAPKGNQYAKGKATGRPPVYRPDFAEQAARLCANLQATHGKLAAFFGVDVNTIYRWMHEHQEFREAVKKSKEVADEMVEQSLFERATGYTFNAVKIFLPKGAKTPVYAPYAEHVPPDPGAAMNWLKNRQPEKWRDRQQVEHSGTISLESLVAGSLDKPKGD